MTLDIATIMEEAHATALAVGFEEDRDQIPVALALIHEEVSEALSEWRHGRAFASTHYETGTNGRPKPCGFMVELADIIIRTARLAASMDGDLERALLEKMAYNKTRPHRHGGMLA